VSQVVLLLNRVCFKSLSISFNLLENLEDNTFLGGFVHKASGMVDKYAGENTRIQLEKGVSTVTQS
jgi:hypothetical protein